MSIQALGPPLDITWTRMAFSRDMLDTNFGDFAFGPKWRSSLAVYFYVVPAEETADAYPSSRIVYLKVTCSITGFNPSEALVGASKIAEDSGQLDDLQKSTWEVITGSDWAEKYWPCVGAIIQLAVYPNPSNGVAPDDFPYILDFEPKKREIYESVTEGSEFLSGSAEQTEITKGSTSVTGLEVSGGAGFSIGGFGASGSVSHTSTDTNVNQKTTDTSREARETLSRTTQSSQMYQLFNGYHLGSNRALFVVAPRPHTVSEQSQTEFNLIDGSRKLEGIQEVFLVMHMPKDLEGFCIQAGLDTGHEVSTTVPYQALMARRVDDGGPPTDHGGRPPVPPPDPTPPTPPTPMRQIVITRRGVQACGTFDQDDRLQLVRLQERRPPLVHGEIVVIAEPIQRAYARLEKDSSSKGRAAAADLLNAVQRQINRLIIDRHTSVGYRPRDLIDTDTFKSLVANAARTSDISIEDLASAGHLTGDELRDLAERKINTVSGLFSMDMSEEHSAATAAIRRRVVDSLATVPRRE